MTLQNPESVGDPNQTPIVQVEPGSGLWKMLNPCTGDGNTWCGGVNGYHEPHCPKFAQPTETP